MRARSYSASKVNTSVHLQIIGSASHAVHPRLAASTLVTLCASPQLKSATLNPPSRSTPLSPPLPVLLPQAHLSSQTPHLSPSCHGAWSHEQNASANATRWSACSNKSCRRRSSAKPSRPAKPLARQQPARQPSSRQSKTRPPRLLQLLSPKAAKLSQTTSLRHSRATQCQSRSRRLPSLLPPLVRPLLSLIVRCHALPPFAACLCSFLC